MYFTIGGRGTQSGLYRVSYVGEESTAPVGPIVDPKATEARATRRKLEAFHTKKDPQAVATAWPYLDNPDRNLRYAARVAIENQDLAQWRDKALAETRTTASIYAMIALARTGAKSDLKPVLDALGKLKLDSLSVEQQLDLLRAYGVAFIRLGPADAATKSEIAARLEPSYPSPVDFVNRELCTLLVYCDSTQVVPKSMALLSTALTQEEQVHYVFTLRLAKAGWTPDLRKAYFSWFTLASKKYQGGHSFKGFRENIRNDAIAGLNDTEKAELKSILEGQDMVQVVQEEKPRKFIHNWQMDDLVPLLGQLDKGRNFERGKAAYKAAQCARCHRFKSEGEGVGHDLTGVGNRFSAHDLLESVILPSKVVSDQYASKTVVTTQGRTITGLVAQLPDGGVDVLQSNFQRVKVAKADIEEIVPSTVSTMPEGLLSILTKEEVLDLVAYLRAAGNAEDKAFQK
jgi:putative heme-binding domain-containing protein